MEPVMTEVKVDGIFNLTKPVMLDHPNLFEAKRAKDRNGKETGEPKFSANLLFPADSADLKAMKALAVQVARAEWPDRDLKTLAWPFKNGDKMADARKAKKPDKTDGEHQRGHAIISSKSKFAPRLSAVINGKLTDLDGDLLTKSKNMFYRGVFVLAQLNFCSYPGVGQNPDGITAYLNMVFSTNKGERLAGGASAAEVFKGYVGHSTDEDPTAGKRTDLDDEIPF